jgi:hypothetical protein
VREEELTRREEALVVKEEKARISEKALTQGSTALDAEQAWAEATRQEYLDKIQAHIDHSNHVLDLDRMLGERKGELNRKEWDLELRVAALAEAHARGLNPQDNHNELMELVELRGLLQDAEVECVIEASRLATLVRDVSKVLEDLGMSRIPGIPRDLCTAGDVLGVVDVILERVKAACDSGHGPWD